MKRPTCHVYTGGRLLQFSDRNCAHASPAEPSYPIPDIPGIIAVVHPAMDTGPTKGLVESVSDAIEAFVSGTGTTVWYTVTKLNSWRVFTIVTPPVRVRTRCDAVTRCERQADGTVRWQLEQVS